MYTSGAIYQGAILRQDNKLDTNAVLTTAPGVYAALYILKECKMKRLMFIVKTAVAANLTAPVVGFYYRPTPGSSSGQVLLGTLTIPNGTAANKVLYKDVEPTTNLLPGGELSLQYVTSATDSGSAAGAGFFGFDIDEIPEVAANQPNMVASA